MVGFHLVLTFLDQPQRGDVHFDPALTSLSPHNVGDLFPRPWPMVLVLFGSFDVMNIFARVSRDIISLTARLFCQPALVPD